MARPRSKHLRQRNKDGSLKKLNTPKENKKKIMATAVKQRLAYCTPSQAKRMAAGDVFGMLLMEGHINQRQYDASQKFTEIVSKYRSVEGLGNEHLKISNLGATPSNPSPTEPDEDYIAKIKSKHFNLIHMLKKVDKQNFLPFFKDMIRDQTTLSSTWRLYTAKTIISQICLILNRINLHC